MRTRPTPRCVTAACVLAQVLICAPVAAEDRPPQAAAFTEAMRHEDYVAKKRAIEALVEVGDDATVIPLLVTAVSDRQAHDVAVRALRERTGLRPAADEGGNTGYPGYPANDRADSWQVWLDAWQRDRARAAALSENRRLIERNRELIERNRRLAEERKAQHKDVPR